MSDPLGLSIGTTNLVAARVGNPPITRPSVLSRPGQMVSGFVERVGDPVPLVAADGSSHQADELVVEALDEMVIAAGGEQSAELTVAVPAHWSGATLRAFREAMRARPRLSPNGTPARLVSDAVASLTALAANPGLPRRGVVALMDFGGGGTSITLADALSGYEPIETVRLPDFSGDQIDQALLAHVLDGIADADDVDPAGTTAVGSLTALRNECRRAKETLSEETSTDVSVDMPGHRSAFRVTRSELEAMMIQPLTAVMADLDDLLQRNRITWADVTAVATVGGGARIPMVNDELSNHSKTPVVTSSRPALDAAVGAAIFAAYGAEADAQTGVAPAPLIGLDPGAPDSNTFRALAWSQDDDTANDPVPYAGEDYDTTSVRAPAQYVQPTGPIDVDRPRAWQRLPQVVLGLAAVVALVAVGGVAIALTSVDEGTPAPTKAPTTSIAPPPPQSAIAPPPSLAPPPPPPSVVTVTSVAPPPPPPETKYVEVPAKTTTTTTTQPTITTTTATTTTTTPTTPTTTTTETSTTPAMTTSYITLPFVPVPIPIQVPNSGQPSYQQPQYQQPQYQQPQYRGQYPY